MLISGTEDDDVLLGGSESDTIQGFGGFDILRGGEADDTLEGGNGDDVLEGGGGDDILIPGQGVDVLNGGDGIDTVRLTASINAVTAVLTDRPAVGEDAYISIERVEGTAGTDSIRGGEAGEIFLGFSGMDFLSGGGGDDRLFGGGFDDRLSGGVGDDLLDGGAGQDEIDFLGTVAVTLDLAAAGPQDTGHGLDTVVSIEDVIGSAAADVISGNGSDNVIEGAGGADTLRGRDGNDVLSAERDSRLFGDAGDDALTALGPSNELDGGAGNDVLTGDGVLLGGDGNDVLLSRWGSLAFGRDPGPDPTFDRLEGGAGDDRIVSYGGASISGGDGADLIELTRFSRLNGRNVYIGSGDSGPATVDAGAGDDRVEAQGQGSAVVLTLGPGRDTLAPTLSWSFFELYPTGNLTVTDFQAGAGGDQVDLAGLLRAFAGLWNPEDNPFSVGVLRIIQVGADAVLQLDWDRGGDDYVTVLRLQNVDVRNLVADNFGGYRPPLIPATDDPVVGTAEPDRLTGGRGDDRLFGLGGADTLTGGQGDDNLSGGDGDDRLQGYGLELMVRREDNDRLDGGAGNDQLDGSEGDDVLQGGAGDDTLIGGVGANALDGGDGVDTADYSAQLSPTFVVVDLSRTGPQRVTLTATDTLVNVENVTGGAGNDALTGSSAANVLNAGDGADFAWGGDGDDTLLMKNGFDQAFGDDGRDYLEGGGGDDLLFGGSGDDWLEGDNQGSARDGPDGRDRLYGDQGNDVVRGGAGSDELFGVSGDDRLDGGSNDDLLDGGEGVDTAVYSSAPGGVVVSLAFPQNTLAAGYDRLIRIENLEGSRFGDALTGDLGRNVLYAAEGDDYVWGGGGDDLIFSKNGRDLAFGDGGADYVEGGGGDDLLFGGEGDDWVEGDYQGPWFDNGPAGADELYGDQGNDVIRGGAGGDRLHGGDGADRFLFWTLSDSTAAAPDRVLDFNGYVDVFDVSAIDADTGTADDQAFRFVDRFTGQAGQAVLAYDAGRNLSTLTLDVNGDAQADFTLEMTGAHATDFPCWLL